MVPPSRLFFRGLWAASLLTTLAAPLPALAGPLDERAADAHFKAVAAGDVDAIMAAYGDDPFLDWVGGSLDGRYRGKEAIRDVWTRYVANNDKQPRTVQRTAIDQNANPKGATLNATIDYVGKATVRVRHVVVYRDMKLVTEVWQIDPNAALVPVTP